MAALETLKQLGTSAPPPLTRRQRWIVAAATIVAGISRIFALARTPWDWDEVLFIEALHHFDVAKHWPHPPGFPLYVFIAKIIRKLGFGDFHALQAVSFLAAIAIVPAMFFLCRELRMRFSTSLSAAVMLAFFPNVWFYGGAAFSDVPSMALAVLSIALLVAGCRDVRAYFAGAILLAVVTGFRPQNLLIGFVPFALASWFQIRRSFWRVAIAVCIVVVIVGGGYGTAAWLTGWSEYHQAVQTHRAYITRTDSFLASHRPPLWHLFDDFFIRPYHAPIVNTIISALALISVAISLIRRRAPILIALIVFAPICLMTWLMLDRFSASRFSIAYAPLLALLAADGLHLIARRPAAEWIGAACIVALMIGWTWPALDQVRKDVSPPIAAVDWIRNHVDARRATVYVDIGMIPYAERYLPDFRLRFIRQTAPPAAWALRQPGYYLREEISSAPHAMNFRWPRGRLWNLARRRYFETSIRPITEMVSFGPGWYEEEGNGSIAWRWMTGRSQAALPPVPGKARLTLSFYVPLDLLKAQPNVAIRLNGAVVDRFQVGSNTVDREVIVASRGDATNELIIETDRVAVPAARHLGSDQRQLGLRLNALGWMPAR